MNAQALKNQHTDLVLAHREAWSIVHGGGDQKLEADCLEILRANGDFAPSIITLAVNGHLYCVLERVDAYIQNRWARDSLKDHILRVLTDHLDVKLSWIRTGNKPDGAAPTRDMSMRPKEYWETRPTPAFAHHWTGDELRDHLIANRFPSNTIDDRLEYHVAQITRALAMGKYVPGEVLASTSGLRAIDDAFMRVRSSIYAQQASRTQNRNQKAFAQSLCARAGKQLAPGEALMEILLAAAKATQEPMQAGLESWVAGGYKRVDLSAAMGYEHPVMVCALGDDRGVRLDIRDGRYGPNSLFSTLLSMRMEEVAPILIDLIESGQASASEIRSVIGYRAMSYLDRPVVQVVCPRGG